MLEAFRIYGAIDLKGGDKVNRELDQIDGKAKGVTAGIGKFARGIGQVAAGIGVFALVSKGIDMIRQSMDGAIDRYDTLNNFPRVMQMIGFDASDSERAIQKLSDGIQGLPTRLDEVASAAQEIALMTNDLDLATDTTLALNNAFIASGSSTADAERGLRQYVQMLAKGKVDQQSWYTLLETMGPALNMVAEEFGFTGQAAKNDLYEALRDGHITFDEFNKKLIELNNAQGGFAEMAQEASGGIKTAWTNMGTWVVMGVTKVIEAIDQALGGTGSLENGIKSLRPIIEGFFGWIASNVPIAINVIRTITDAAKSFYDTIKPWLPLLGAIAAAVVSFMATLSTFNSVAGIVQKVITTFKSLRTVIMAVNAAFLANPIGIIVASIAALVAAGYVLIRNWDSIKAKVLEVFPAMEPVFSLFEQAFQRAKDGVTRAVDALKMAWEGLKPVITTLAQILGVFLVNAIGMALGVFNGLVNAIGPVISMFSNLLSFITNFVASLVSLFRGDLTGAIEHWKNAGTAAVQVFIDALEAIITFVAGFVETIVEFFRGLYNTLVGNSIIPDMVNAIVDWFKNLVTWVVNIVKNLVKGIVNGFKNLLNQTKNIFNNIRNFIQNVWNNIRSAISSAVNAICSIVTSVFNAIRSVISSIMSGIRSIITSVWNTIRSIITSVVNAIRNVIRSVFNSLRGIVTSAFSGVVSAIRSGIQRGLSVVTGFASRFLQAGRNLVTSIANGIKSAIGNVTGAIGSVASKIRNFLPFSPAKEGPLMDLDKLDFAGPIGDSILKAERILKSKMNEMLGNIHPSANLSVDVGNRVASTGNGQLSKTTQVFSDERITVLLRELIQAVKDGKVINVNGRVLGEINDEEQARRVDLSGRVAY